MRHIYVCHMNKKVSKPITHVKCVSKGMRDMPELRKQVSN